MTSDLSRATVDVSQKQENTSQSRHLSLGFFELSNRHSYILVGFLTLIAFVVRIRKALKPGGLIHPDEIYQSLEIAHDMEFGYGIIPWEFQIGGWEGYGPARSYIFPWIYYVIFKIGLFFRLTYPDDILLLVRIFDASISALVIPIIFLFIRELTKRNLLAILCATLVSIWYELTFYGIRSLTNSFVVPFLYLTFYFFLRSLSYPMEKSKTRTSIALFSSLILLIISFFLKKVQIQFYLLFLVLFFFLLCYILISLRSTNFVSIFFFSLLTGLTLGFCFYIRPDIVLLVIPATLLRLRFKHWQQVIIVTIGFVIMSFIHGFFDLHYSGQFYVTTLNWWRFLNEMQTVFGVSPPGFYTQYLFLNPDIFFWLGVLSLFFYLIDFRRFLDTKQVDTSFFSYFKMSIELFIWFASSLILWECVEHKENRFVQPLFPLFLIFISIGIYRLILEFGLLIETILRKESWMNLRSWIEKQKISFPRRNFFFSSFLTQISIKIFPRHKKIRKWAQILFLGLLIINFSIVSLDEANKVEWSYYGDVHMAMMWVGHQEDLRGLCMIANWFVSGGYTYLHRNVPIHFWDDPGSGLTFKLRYYNHSEINYLIIPKYKYSWYPSLQNDSLDLGYQFIREVDQRCDVYVFRDHN